MQCVKSTLAVNYESCGMCSCCPLAYIYIFKSELDILHSLTRVPLELLVNLSFIVLLIFLSS